MNERAAVMSERAAALASQFEQANNAVVAAVVAASDAEWRHVTPAEGWSVGVTARHVAVAYIGISDIVRAAIDGQPIPSLDRLDEFNAQHAREHADCTRADVLALLKSNGESVANYLRGLSDEQLDRSAAMPLAGGAPLSAQQLIESALIGHPQEHLASIHAAREA